MTRPWKITGGALALAPGRGDIYNNLGNVLQDLGRHGEALETYERALALKPDSPEAHNNRGNALRHLRRFTEAFESYERAIALKPDYAEAYYDYGNALKDLKRYDEALKYYEKALALKPDYPEAYNNRGNALQCLKRYDEALESYGKAIAQKPGYADANWNKSLLLILIGEYREGWRLFEWRWQTDDTRPLARHFAQPLWLGDAETEIGNKTILLYAEQGLGDTLQMLRYVPLLAAQGATVILEVPLPLVSLASEIPEAGQVIARGEPLPVFDVHCPFMSLPLAFKTTVDTIPKTVPYLKAPEMKKRLWRDRIGLKTRPRIGLMWSGSTWHKNDRNRSIPLEKFLPLLEWEADFHSLQKEYRASDREVLMREGRIRDHSEELADFGDTAGLMEQLDLVISVDTAVAHLAGALGKTVWVLLPHAPDYRWSVDRKDSAWYPTARLFRQAAPDDWDQVIHSVAMELKGFLRP